MNEWYNDDKYEYADGLMRSLKYHCSMLVTLGERLDMLAWQLSGTVSSPRIKSIEESKYQSGTQIYRNNIVELLEQEQEAMYAYREHERAWYRIAEFLQQLEEEDVRMLTLYYEYHLTYERIGDIMHMSRNSVRRRIRKCLMKL